MKTVASPDVTVEKAVEQIDIGKIQKPVLRPTERELFKILMRLPFDFHY